METQRATMTQLDLSMIWLWLDTLIRVYGPDLRFFIDTGSGPRALRDAYLRQDTTGKYSILLRPENEGHDERP